MDGGKPPEEAEKDRKFNDSASKPLDTIDGKTSGFATGSDQQQFGNERASGIGQIITDMMLNRLKNQGSSLVMTGDKSPEFASLGVNGAHDYSMVRLDGPEGTPLRVTGQGDGAVSGQVPLTSRDGIVISDVISTQNDRQLMGSDGVVMLAPTGNPIEYSAVSGPASVSSDGIATSLDRPILQNVQQLGSEVLGQTSPRIEVRQSTESPQGIESAIRQVLANFESSPEKQAVSAAQLGQLAEYVDALRVALAEAPPPWEQITATARVDLAQEKLEGIRQELEAVSPDNQSQIDQLGARIADWTLDVNQALEAGGTILAAQQFLQEISSNIERYAGAQSGDQEVVAQARQQVLAALSEAKTWLGQVGDSLEGTTAAAQGALRQLSPESTNREVLIQQVNSVLDAINAHNIVIGSSNAEGMPVENAGGPLRNASEGLRNLATALGGQQLGDNNAGADGQSILGNGDRPIDGQLAFMRFDAPRTSPEVAVAEMNRLLGLNAGHIEDEFREMVVLDSAINNTIHQINDMWKSLPSSSFTQEQLNERRREVVALAQGLNDLFDQYNQHSIGARTDIDNAIHRIREYTNSARKNVNDAAGVILAAENRLVTMLDKTWLNLEAGERDIAAARNGRFDNALHDLQGQTSNGNELAGRIEVFISLAEAVRIFEDVNLKDLKMMRDIMQQNVPKPALTEPPQFV